MSRIGRIPRPGAFGCRRDDRRPRGDGEGPKGGELTHTVAAPPIAVDRDDAGASW